VKVVDPGHLYILRELDGSQFNEPVYLTFVKRKGPNYPGNEDAYAGTTLQEVLRACCERLRYVGKQGEILNQPENEANTTALGHLREAILALEVRAAKRHGRDSSTLTLDEAEFGKTCTKCNHVGCEGGCH